MNRKIKELVMKVLLGESKKGSKSSYQRLVEMNQYPFRKRG